MISSLFPFQHHFTIVCRVQYSEQFLKPFHTPTPFTRYITTSLHHESKEKQKIPTSFANRRKAGKTARMSIPQSVEAALKRAHQEHVLQYVNASDISDSERARLYKQVHVISTADGNRLQVSTSILSRSRSTRR